MSKLLIHILNLLARLPWRCLYGLSTVIYLLAYYVVRYRRRLVHENMRLALPQYTPRERRHLEREFYHNFTDYFVETVKLAHITDKEMLSRLTFEGMEIIDNHLRQGRSVVAYFSHTFNWEWVPSITLHSHFDSAKMRFCQVYRPLRNKPFDEWFLNLRSRFHSLSLPKKVVLRDLLRLRRDGLLTITGFMSDQKPSHGDPTHVIEFLHRPTAMITGTETLARRLQMAVVYFDLEKVSRGHYHLTVRPMADNAADIPATEATPYPLTDLYARLLEDTINRQPSLWLWSHNRWKNPVTLCQNPAPQQP